MPYAKEEENSFLLPSFSRDHATIGRLSKLFWAPYNVAQPVRNVALQLRMWYAEIVRVQIGCQYVVRQGLLNLSNNIPPARNRDFLKLTSEYSINHHGILFQADWTGTPGISRPSKHTTSFLRRYTTLFERQQQRCYNVETTSCANWDGIISSKVFQNKTTEMQNKQKQRARTATVS